MSEQIELKQVWHIEEHEPAKCAVCGDPSAESIQGFLFKLGNGRACLACANEKGFAVEPDLLQRILRAYQTRPRT